MTRLRTALLPPLLAVVFAAMLSSIALLISGDNPAAALAVMITQLGAGTTAVDVLNTGAIYYIAGLAVAIGFKMKLFNIGVEGQYRIAACVAAIVGGMLPLPPVLHVIVIMLTGVLVGMLWALVPALLRAYRGVHEVISTIMLNAVATGVIAYLISPSAFGVVEGNNISTRPIAPSGWFPGIDLGRGTIFGMVFVAAALGVGYWFLLSRTRFGFELAASGESPTAATAGGVDARRMVMIAMLMSGAVAGLIGLPEVLGRDHAYSIVAPQGYGFTGIAIALLGRNHPFGVAVGALLWAFLDKSALALDNIGVPREIVLIMQGVIVLSVVVAYEIVRRYSLAAEQRRVAAELRAAQQTPVAEGAPS
ncbi:MAG: ABC transporter permease [Pseudonocardia sp.]|nr:ABC transporter permease [Pseudonocardia sp.]